MVEPDSRTAAAASEREREREQQEYIQKIIYIV